MSCRAGKQSGTSTVKVDPLERLQRYTRDEGRRVLNKGLGGENACVAKIDKCVTEKDVENS